VTAVITVPASLDEQSFEQVLEQLAPLWHRNGVAYALRRDTLAAGLLLGARTGGFVIDGPVANIDDALDLAWAEFLLERGLG
jgi:CMP-N-acetylneuraminic acid synthetase